MKIEEITSNQTLTDLLKRSDQVLIKIITPEGIVWWPKGINLDRAYGERTGQDWPYSRVIGCLICQCVVEGKGLVEISKQEGYPPYKTILYWRTKPEFGKMLSQAFKDKAEYNAEKAIKLAGEGETTKLHVDTLKWSAASDNPDKYGSKKPKKTLEIVTLRVEDKP